MKSVCWIYHKTVFVSHFLWLTFSCLHCWTLPLLIKW